MQRIPFLQQAARFGGIEIGRQEPLVGRHDDQKSERNDSAQEDCADQPPITRALEPGYQRANQADDG